MKFDFSTPMTTYELIAMVISILALVLPIIRWIYDTYIKRLRIDFLPSGMITLFHNKSGSYLSFGGVYEAKNKSTTIKSMSAKVIRKADNATLPLTWSIFPSPVFRDVGGKYESSFETAHPFKVDADTLAPAFIEFRNAQHNMEEVSESLLLPVVNASSSVLYQQNATLPAVDQGVKALREYSHAKLALNDYFFWKPGEYEIILETSHSKGFFGKSFYITLTSEESAKLRENIDNMLVIHVAEHFRVNLPFNTVRKSFDSHGDSK